MTKAAKFETSIKALEDIVHSLEKGDVSLDEALKQFEKGIGLTQTCQALLSEAEQKVDKLMQNANNPSEHND